MNELWKKIIKLYTPSAGQGYAKLGTDRKLYRNATFAANSMLV